MVLEIKNLTKCYGEKEALSHLDLKLQSGIYGLLGPNGAGKSTFMKLICMLLEPTEGEIFFEGNNIRKMRQEFLKVLGYMPQHSRLYPEFKTLEYLYYVGSLKGMRREQVCRSAEKLLRQTGLWEVKDQKIKTLSGGMQQRLMFAQALLDSPRVVILDEPTAGLDPKRRIEMRNLISETAKDKIVLIATHVVSDVETIADRILLLKQGKLASTDSVEGLRTWLYETYPLEEDTKISDLERVYLHYFGEEEDA